jgi:hypothetical protein
MLKSRLLKFALFKGKYLSSASSIQSNGIAKYYPVPPNHPYPEEAYMFGRKPGTPLEGWEYIAWGTFFLSFAIVISGSYTKTNIDFKTWARKEYLARELAREQGEVIEFGKYYNKDKYNIGRNTFD